MGRWPAESESNSIGTTRTRSSGRPQGNARGVRAVAEQRSCRPEFRTDRQRRAVPLFVGDQFEIQVYRIVVQQLLELRGRYLVVAQVLLVLVVPIEFDSDSAGHRPILYRNVYTFRIGSDPPRYTFASHVPPGQPQSAGAPFSNLKRAPVPAGAFLLTEKRYSFT